MMLGREEGSSNEAAKVADSTSSWTGVSAPPSFEGGSLAAAMGRAHAPGFFEKLTGKRQKDVPPAYSELLQVPDQKPTVSGAPLQSVIVGAHKLIVHQDGTTEAYDLGADPGETNGGALTATDRSALQEMVTRITRQTSRSAAPAPTVALDETTDARLRALGYIH